VPKLVVKQGGQTRDIVLTKENFSIGRTPENDLEVRDSLISRRHSSIIRRGDRYVVYDLGSSNGTFVNRERVEMKPLDHGDVIRVGDTEILFHDESRPAKPPTAPHAILDSPSSAQIVQSVDEVGQNYSLDITEALNKGLSLKEIRSDVAGEKAAKDSKMFFILFQVGKALSNAASLDDMLRTATRLIFEVVNAERAVILLRCTKEGECTPRLCYHRSRGIMDAKDIPISHTITSQVVNEKVSIITSDALQDPRFMQGLSIVQYNIRSALCVPLWEDKQIYGAIYLDNLAKTYAFTKDDLELMTAIANLIAIRIRQDETQARLRQEEMTRVNLMKFHSPDVVNAMMTRGGEAILEVIDREVSVIFVDIEGFTKLSEARPAKEVVGLLNEFFLLATDAVFAQKGNLNKFIGDEVMAIYNAPLDIPDHAAAAVRTCIQMIQSLEKFNQANPDRRYNVRCAVNTGPAVVGNVGTPARMEYTALGDTVNTASRLSKFPQVNRVVIGERTYELVKGIFKTKDLGTTMLKGKEKPFHAYEIVI
jgi:adenylate cyclase